MVAILPLVPATTQAKPFGVAQGVDQSIALLSGEATHLAAYRDLVAGGKKSTDSLVREIGRRLEVSESGRIEQLDVGVVLGAVAALEEINSLDDDQIESLAAQFMRSYLELPDRVRSQFGMMIGRRCAGMPIAKSLKEFLQNSAVMRPGPDLVSRMLCRLDWSEADLESAELRLQSNDPLEVEAASYFVADVEMRQIETKVRVLQQLAAVEKKSYRDSSPILKAAPALLGTVTGPYPKYARSGANLAIYRLTRESPELADLCLRIRGCCIGIRDAASPNERLQAVLDVRILAGQLSEEAWLGEAREVVSALTGGLTDVCREVRVESCVTLGLFGRMAAAAVPSLEAVAREAAEASAIRIVAERALLQIAAEPRED